MNSPQSNREIILQRALEAFARKGYEACGISEITTAAGITKPTLYHYFGSKLGLYTAILDKHAPPFIEISRQNLTQERDVSTTLAHFTSTLLAAVDDQPKFTELVLKSLANPTTSASHSPFRTSLARFTQPIFGYFDAMNAQRGGLPKRSLRHAHTFLALIRMSAERTLAGDFQLPE